MSPTYPSENTQGFASLLYVVLILDKRHDVRQVAAALDVSPSTLYSYCHGQRVFPPDLIAPLYLVTGERRFLSFFLDEAGVAFHELPECPEGEGVDRAVLQEAIVAQEECLDLLKATLRSLADDGRIDRRELVEIETKYFTTQGALARLLACVRADARRIRPRREG